MLDLPITHTSIYQPCGIWCNTQSVLDEHLAGTKHKRVGTYFIVGIYNPIARVRGWDGPD